MLKKPKNSVIVYSRRFNEYSYGETHPFKPDRAGITMKLIRGENFLNEPWMRVEEPILITKEKLLESHDPEYVAALEFANAGRWDDKLIQFNLGIEECPIFPGLFDYVLLYTSATLTGVDLIINEKAGVVFNLLGGFHHASRKLAGGFCYINDVLSAIDSFILKGLRVAYVDLDAHHGNGVQDAYYQDDRVLTISVHQDGKTLYPWGGFENEIGEGSGKGYNINIPLPPETDDEAYQPAIDSVVIKALEFFRPDVIVAVVGADTHKNDPLTNLSLTNNGMAHAVEKIKRLSDHLLLLGGGGYDMSSTAKAWCRIWAAANGINSTPEELTLIGGTFMGSEELRGAGIIDRAYIISGERKKEIVEEIKRVINYHQKNTLPLLLNKNP